MFEVNDLDHVSVKVDALTQKINNLSITPPASVDVVTPSCVIYGIQEKITIDRRFLTWTIPDQVNCA